MFDRHCNLAYGVGAQQRPARTTTYRALLARQQLLDA
jgi:hypothetical protein